jgi:uncharacterized protein YndB with AHSA1/START domain
MTRNLAFDFNVDKDSNTIRVKREFAAPLQKVWDAWTRSELLDQWWAPKPYKAVTKEMNFAPGGHWLYAMTGPDNFRQWARADYDAIEPLKSYSAVDAFCDEEGRITDDYPGSKWTNSFSDNGATTVVDVSIKFDKLADLEKHIEMGFKEGFTMGLENLDELLASEAM